MGDRLYIDSNKVFLDIDMIDFIVLVANTDSAFVVPVQKHSSVDSSRKVLHPTVDYYQGPKEYGDDTKGKLSHHRGEEQLNQEANVRLNLSLGFCTLRNPGTDST